MPLTATALQRLTTYREVWAQKALLRRLYQEYYRRIAAMLPHPAGRLVELGGGTGNLKASLPRIVSTDIIRCPWLDAVVDAQAMPFADGRIDAFIAVDVLHHLEYPFRFFREAERCLRPGGRILLVDPYISPFSYLVLKLLHPEPVDFSKDFFAEFVEDGSFGKDPWDANQAMATVLFWKQRKTFERRFPRLRILIRETFNWVWPLTGGFSYPALVPERCAEWLCRINQWRLANRLSAFHAFVAIEKVR